jgi:hypothetical protein
MTAFRWFLAFVLVVCAALACEASAKAETFFDAAIQQQGVPFDGYAGLRVVIDNSAGSEMMTGVKFYLRVHGGDIDSGNVNWAWDDPTNPWFGCRSTRVADEFAIWYESWMYSPTSREWSPVFHEIRQPGHPLYIPFDPELMDPAEAEFWDQQYNAYTWEECVPPGFIWDHVFYLSGEGLEIFSVAEGELRTGGITVQLTDADPEPQSAPEPASLALLAAGAMAMLRRRRFLRAA